MEKAISAVQDIFTDQINDPANPMRSDLDRDGLFELAANIKQNGLINPITVRPVADRFEVVAGHRRLGACRIAGLIRIPCVVRELTDEQAFAVMTAENLERADVPLLDECRHYKAAIERFGKTLEEIAKAAKRSVSYIQSRLAIADMPDYLQNYLQSGDIKLGAALALTQITDESRRRVWTDMAVRDGVSVAQAEYWLHGWVMNQLPDGSNSSVPPEGYESGVPPVVKFECAVDGKKYDARQFKTVMVWEGNLEMLTAVLMKLRDPSDSESVPPRDYPNKDPLQ